MAPSSASSYSPSPPSSWMTSPVWGVSSLSPLLLAGPMAPPTAIASEVGPGLVPITTGSYIVPGGSYHFLCSSHRLGSCNAINILIDDLVRQAVASSVPTTMKEEEFAVRGFPIGKGCSATKCGLDKDSTTGLFMRYNSDQGSGFIPSTDRSTLSPPTNSQVAIPESVIAPSTQSSSVPTIVASSWSTTPPPALAAPPTSEVSFMGDLSSGERALYGKKFRLVHESDEDYAPPKAGSRVRAWLESPRKRAPTCRLLTPSVGGMFLKAIDKDKGRKKLIVPVLPRAPLKEHCQ